MCIDGDCDKQASPDSDNDKKGRERDGKREKDLEKDKENDKSRGKSRSDSKQKSPKRKAPKEEVGFAYYYCVQRFFGYEEQCEYMLPWLRKLGGLRELHTWLTSWGSSGSLVDELKTLETLHLYNQHRWEVVAAISYRHCLPPPLWLRQGFDTI